MFNNINFQEMLIVGVIAVMLYGKRLPEVARSFGATYRKFREGLADFQRQMEMATQVPPPSKWSQSQRESPDKQAPTAPKFEPPTLSAPVGSVAKPAPPTSDVTVTDQSPAVAERSSRIQA